jgi:hypothetical protein
MELRHNMLLRLIGALVIIAIAIFVVLLIVNTI